MPVFSSFVENLASMSFVSHSRSSSASLRTARFASARSKPHFRLVEGRRSQQPQKSSIFTASASCTPFLLAVLDSLRSGPCLSHLLICHLAGVPDELDIFRKRCFIFFQEFLYFFFSRSNRSFRVLFPHTRARRFG